MTNKRQSLAQQIEATVAAFMADLPEAEAQIIADSFAHLNASNAAANAITVGEQAPDFLLPNAQGTTVRLYDRLASGPVVLSFYRGGWCPFCNLELQALQPRLPDIAALGASLIALSPETPDNSLTTAEKLQLDFDVLSDPGNRTAREYGLLSAVYEAMRPLYLKWGLDVPAANGDDNWELPVPATYLVDISGKIHSAYIDSDYTRRMDPGQLVAQLRDLQGH
jgi:peroxiredoxin